MTNCLVYNIVHHYCRVHGYRVGYRCTHTGDSVCCEGRSDCNRSGFCCIGVVVQCCAWNIACSRCIHTRDNICIGAGPVVGHNAARKRSGEELGRNYRATIDYRIRKGVDHNLRIYRHKGGGGGCTTVSVCHLNGIGNRLWCAGGRECCGRIVNGCAVQACFWLPNIACCTHNIGDCRAQLCRLAVTDGGWCGGSCDNNLRRNGDLHALE